MLTEINLLNNDFYSNFTRVFMWNIYMATILLSVFLNGGAAVL